jgi:outer membrane protein assembly factor BamB
MKRLSGILVAALVVAGLATYRHVSRHSVSVVLSAADARPVRETEALTTPADWPCWRGSLATGISLTARPPRHWSESDGVRWKVAVPGRGHSSPIVVGDRVVITTADEDAGTISLLCFDRRDGSRIWEAPLQHGGLMTKHEKNSHASPTPACDGRRVYVPFVAEDALWTTAVDLEGREVWRVRVGPYHSQWGYGSSPVYWRGLVIVAADNKGSRLADLAATTSYLTALDAATGDVVWRVRRPREHSYGTPVVGEVAGRWQLLLGGHEAVYAYEPATGQELWRCSWPVGRAANTVAFDGERVFATGTFPESETVCIRGDGSGDISETHVLWRQRRGAADVPSPLAIDGRVLVVGDNGVATLFNAATGRTAWQQRLAGAFTSSPVKVGGVIYAVNEDGRAFVFRAGVKFESVAESRLDGTVYATPTPAGDDLFIRTDRRLYCLTNSAAPVARGK